MGFMKNKEWEKKRKLSSLGGGVGYHNLGERGQKKKKKKNRRKKAGGGRAGLDEGKIK